MAARKPATAIEVQEFFKTADLPSAVMLHQLVGRDLKARMPKTVAATSRTRGKKDAPATATSGVMQTGPVHAIPPQAQ